MCRSVPTLPVPKNSNFPLYHLPHIQLLNHCHHCYFTPQEFNSAIETPSITSHNSCQTSLTVKYYLYLALTTCIYWNFLCGPRFPQYCLPYIIWCGRWHSDGTPSKLRYCLRWSMVHMSRLFPIWGSRPSYHFIQVTFPHPKKITRSNVLSKSHPVEKNSDPEQFRIPYGQLSK